METPIGKVCSYLHNQQKIRGLRSQNGDKLQFCNYATGAGGGAYMVRTFLSFSLYS